jgi:hypothetical protein
MSDTTSPTGLKPTQATAIASNSVGGALTVLIVWGISKAWIPVPAEVAAALGVIVGNVVHIAVLKWGINTTSA